MTLHSSITHRYLESTCAALNQLDRAAPAHRTALLAVIAGGLLFFQGLWSFGLLPHLRLFSGHGSNCPGRSAFSTFLSSPNLHDVFIAGLLTGFLPCGLVYGFLTLAAIPAFPCNIDSQPRIFPQVVHGSCPLKRSPRA